METETTKSDSEKVAESYIKEIQQLDLIMDGIEYFGIDDANVDAWLTEIGADDLAERLGIAEDEVGPHHILDLWIENQVLEMKWFTKNSFDSDPMITSVELLVGFGGPNVWIILDVVTDSAWNCEVKVKWWGDDVTRLIKSDVLHRHVKDLVESGIYCA
tara:strand:- start:20120 stop:20596 length:477 start_codon:yes stop_codon:yes gene_type:complete